MAFDQHGRHIDYLRVSVTDRCNLRCLYCMPEEGVAWRPHEAMLTLEEIARFIAVAATEGIKRIRLTGGEPLVRRGIDDLVRSAVRTPGIESVAMTTNGILLPKMADSLRQAGLSRVNISLDTLDPEQYRYITRWGTIDDAFKGIDTALATGFKPVKINVVVVRSLHQDLLAFARMSMDRPLHVRFIEYMPVGESCGGAGLGWTAADTIPNEELIDLISQSAAAAGLGQLTALSKPSEAPDGWGPARYYHLEGAQGTLGFISALSRHFCGQCNRLRLTAEGELLPCLFSDLKFDAKAALREGTDEDVRAVLLDALGSKPSSHHNRVGTERLMHQIGG
ncbi:MAG: GTP 3',8-cyclase MoaA [Coriobacteriales bacterium]|jgi:cyclic pyranopterin phosphate synthase|nr:GTP 3',8-cyclase MoaA [Coriobacteriales bacterium]